ncbi:MAG TPA: site-specific integrase [Gammaproteobacteria bacterium]|nr:site-specific integrase [Gammaproteobacteria bacterium]
MTLSDAELEALYRAADATEFAARDAALVRAALYWGFTATELSLLEVQHVLTVDGEWRERFVLPAAFAFNGLARTAWLRDPAFVASLETWLHWRAELGWDRTEANRFRGFEAKAPLFVNNHGRPFAMTPRSPGSTDLLPSGMNRQLRELLDRAGLQHHSPHVLRDTYIVRLWQRGLSRHEIMQLTGIRKAETISRKIRHLIPEPRQVFADFLPGHSTA